MPVEINIPRFENIEISTKTIIAISNLRIDIEQVFWKLPITKYIIVPKKRGRKRKEPCVDPNKDIPSGSIITLKYRNLLRGVDLKKKKSKKPDKYFRNAITIVMTVDNKMINFKLSKNGKFQLTGCKNDLHAEKCIQYIWEYVKENTDDNEPVYAIDVRTGERIWNNKVWDEFLYEIDGTYLKVIFLTVMTNIDFKLGFLVNRENLDRYINKKTDHNSLLELSFGYTGVNIKLPSAKPTDLDLRFLAYKDNEWEKSTVPYCTYLEMLKDKERLKEENKNRQNTFLVFHSGNCIMSGMHTQYMRDVYYEFFKIVEDCRDIIEEKLDI